MSHHHFTDEEIKAAPAWLAREMRLLNESNYYLDSSRLFMIAAWIGITTGFILGMVFDRFWASMAAYTVGMIGNLVAALYLKRAKNIMQQSRYWSNKE